MLKPQNRIITLSTILGPLQVKVAGVALVADSLARLPASAMETSSESELCWERAASLCRKHSLRRARKCCEIAERHWLDVNMGGVFLLCASRGKTRGCVWGERRGTSVQKQEISGLHAWIRPLKQQTWVNPAGDATEMRGGTTWREHDRSQGGDAAWPVHVLVVVMDKLTVISGCLFLAADIFAIASIANPDWISTGDSAGRWRFWWNKVEFFPCVFTRLWSVIYRVHEVPTGVIMISWSCLKDKNFTLIAQDNLQSSVNNICCAAKPQYCYYATRLHYCVNMSEQDPVRKVRTKCAI